MSIYRKMSDCKVSKRLHENHFCICTVIQFVLYFYTDKPVYPLGTLSIFPFNGLPRKVAVNISENKENNLILLPMQFNN